MVSSSSASEDWASTGVIAEGKDGVDGTPGSIITIVDGYWYIDGVSTGMAAQGPKGDTGATGPQGEKGDKGEDGADAAVSGGANAGGESNAAGGTTVASESNNTFGVVALILAIVSVLGNAVLVVFIFLGKKKKA